MPTSAWHPAGPPEGHGGLARPICTYSQMAKTSLILSSHQQCGLNPYLETDNSAQYSADKETAETPTLATVRGGKGKAPRGSSLCCWCSSAAHERLRSTNEASAADGAAAPPKEPGGQSRGTHRTCCCGRCRLRRGTAHGAHLCRGLTCSRRAG